MSEPDDLKRKLDALADATSAFGVRGRLISEGGLPTPVQAILTEVSETVLAQDLTFHIGEVGSLVLIVSGRRVLAVRSVDGLVMPAVAEQLAGKPLGSAADATQRALLALLMQIDLMTDTVETTAADGAPFSAPPDAGLSPERLAALVGVTFPFVMPTPMERLLAALPVPPGAVVLKDAGAVVSETGEADQCARLHAMADGLGASVETSAGPAKLSIIGQQSGDGLAIGAATDKNSHCLWTMPIQSIGVATTAFHKIFGGRDV
ncbi:MAG: hypothetical protein AAGB05_03295 [Pseudomonadota bacterium]